jgi:hypothetical protein
MPSFFADNHPSRLGTRGGQLAIPRGSLRTLASVPRGTVGAPRFHPPPQGHVIMQGHDGTYRHVPHHMVDAMTRHLGARVHHG